MASEVDKFKAGFFDRGKVLDAMDKSTRRMMTRTGGYVRKVARNSMKKKKGPSPPGSPPHVHEGSLKNLLFFAYDTQSKSLVVGPVGFAGSKAPATLEFGGGKTGKRPYMKPAMDAALPTMAPSIKFGG